jgi:hypothetical protein
MNPMTRRLLYAYVSAYEKFSNLRLGKFYPLRILHYYLVTHFFHNPVTRVKEKIFFLHFDDKVISSEKKFSHWTWRDAAKVYIDNMKRGVVS